MNSAELSTEDEKVDRNWALSDLLSRSRTAMTPKHVLESAGQEKASYG
jgi:hypothetical protein